MAKQLNIETVGKAIADNYGLILHASKQLGCSRLELCIYINKNPQLQTTINNARNKLTSLART